MTIDDVAALAMAFPGVTEGTSYGNRSWKVGKVGFVWERPFSKADLRRFGDERVPDGPIIALRVEDLTDKEAVLGEGRSGFFTIPHFDGYAAVLVDLSVAGERHVRESVEDAWLCCASDELRQRYRETGRA